MRQLAQLDFEKCSRKLSYEGFSLKRPLHLLQRDLIAERSP